MSNRVVAVTGASAGIGRAIALRMARQGDALVVCARRADRLEDLARQIVAAGGQALPVVADVAHESAMRDFVARAVDRFGRLDVMVCNAGFGIAGAIDQIDAAQMRRLIDVNYMGTYYAAREAMIVFRRQKTGHVIVVSSIVGKRAVPYVGAYAATKFAQVGLAESLRAEVVGSNIHVSVVLPVSTDSEFHEVMAHESGTEVTRLGPRQPAETVADAIARAIDRPDRYAEVYPHQLSRGLVLFNAVAPRLCDRFVQRFGRTPMRER